MFNERTAPSDVVLIILSLLGKGKTFPSDKKFLCKKFFELSKKFSELFQDFIFDGSEKCKEVDIVINRITRFEMAEQESPKDDFSILPALVSKGKVLMKLFSASERDQLSKAAGKFAEMIKSNYKEDKKCVCVVCKCG